MDPHMNGGENKASYAENSLLQKMVIKKAKHIVEESIRELCTSTLPKCINVADLGCSSGPNALLTIQEIMQIITNVCRELNRKPPSVQFFLNDLVVNDFNTLFKSLPMFYEELERLDERNNSKSCFIAAMPGSFYGRLFPDHSIHFVHSSYCLHWISQAPVELVGEFGESLNKNNICLAKTSSRLVHNAYMDQFKKDFTIFLRMRSEEMAVPGHLALSFVCKNDENDGYDICEFVGMEIDNMVKEGIIEESKLATFNIPYYVASTEEITQTIESEGSFELWWLETFKLPWDANMEDREKGISKKLEKEEHLAMFTRSVLEPMIVSHFGESIVDELFQRFGKNATAYLQMGKGKINTAVICLAKK